MERNLEASYFQDWLISLLRVIFGISFSFSFLFFFTASPAAYGSSQTRGQIGAAAEDYVTATAMLDLSHICDLQHLWQLAATLDP